MVEIKALKQQRQVQAFTKEITDKHYAVTEIFTSLETKYEKNDSLRLRDRFKAQELEIVQVKAENEEVIKKMKLFELWVLSRHMTNERQKQQEMNKNSLDLSLSRLRNDKINVSKSNISTLSGSTTQSNLGGLGTENEAEKNL